MVPVLAAAVFALTSAGVYLLLQRRTLRVILGLALLSQAVNLILLSTGRVGWAQPLIVPGLEAADVADPVPQAFVLTAIVISMALTLYLLAGLAARAWRGEGVDLDAAPDSDGDAPPAAVLAELEGRTADAEAVRGAAGREGG
jgi:multicomponent Na+:H+ antiporter subunit C